MTRCTIFVGGITLITTKENIETYFAKYGIIHKVIIPYEEHKKTQQFKGYALITFEDPECVKTCLNEKNHIILNRKVHCSLALSKKEARQIIADKSKRKLFVGGLSQKTTQGKLIFSFPSSIFRYGFLFFFFFHN